MSLWSRLKPAFWDQSQDQPTQIINYRRLWKSTFGAAVGVALLPVILLGIINYYQFEEQHQLQRAELDHEVQRVIYKTRVSLAYFLEERRSALAYIVRAYSLPELGDSRHLARIFANLKGAFGGFVDLGLITSDGLQKAYVGPYALEGKDYRDQEWYKEVLLRGFHVSDVFMGHRNFPHFVIAVKHECDTCGYYILRATIDTARLNELIATMRLRPSADAFIINDSGVLQTSSRMHGQILSQFSHPLPPPLEQNQVVQARSAGGLPLILGFARIEGSPFTLVMVEQPSLVLARWGLLRINIILLVLASVIAILVVIWRGTTNLVSRLYDADLRRQAVLHQIEYTNKLASIGRLAAGVAHEINNPLAIINEKAGLLKDLITSRDDSPYKERFLASVGSIQNSVKRVSAITHRLLGFARHFSVKIEIIDLELLIEEVLGFLGKEAEYRNVTISTQAQPGMPTIESDRGQLQQVFLNILNNALNAVAQGPNQPGRIDISIHTQADGQAVVAIADNGQGIAPENLERVFEPFFTTKGEQGTGLGLSITYGIVRKLGGQVMVESQLGRGTTFRVVMPLRKTPASANPQAANGQGLGASGGQ
ncbi:MAG: ATP-binding protein [Desulfarculus sp.]|nr:ATP-binding protein [Desulfarculus sp.]